MMKLLTVTELLALSEAELHARRNELNGEARKAEKDGDPAAGNQYRTLASNILLIADPATRERGIAAYKKNKYRIEMGPEERRLIDRLCNDQSHKLVNFNIFPGDRSHKCTTEELCAEINKAFDQVESGAVQGSPHPAERDVPQIDVREWLLERRSSST